MELVIASKNMGDDSLYKIFDIDIPGAVPNALAFLRENSLTTLKNKFSTCQRAQASFKSTDSLRETWKTLLVDSIYFLRINDNRENHFFEDIKRKNKATMRSEGISDSIQSNVYGIEELVEYFAQFSDFESTLYGADKYYRDHIVHPLNVWFIGLHIIREYGRHFKLRVMNDISIEDCEYAKPDWFQSKVVVEKKDVSQPAPDGDKSVQEEGSQEYNGCRLSVAELAAMWTIVALTHDLGYPLEKVEKVNDKLEKMLSKFGKIGFSRFRFNFEVQHDHLVRFLLNLISAVAKPLKKADDEFDFNWWRTHIRTKYYSKFSKSWEMFDHGIVSSLILLKSLTFFIESDFCSEYNEPISKEDARQFAIRSEILHAMASHTTAKIYHLSPDNLPFLLILCDDLQEWSRPTLGDMKIGIKGDAVNVLLRKFEINKNGSSIHCVINYPHCDYEDQEEHAIRVFKVWLERFRPALDDKERSIDFCWEIQFGEETAWSFRLDTSQHKNFKTFAFKRPKKGTGSSEDFDLHKADEEMKARKNG